MIKKLNNSSTFGDVIKTVNEIIDYIDDEQPLTLDIDPEYPRQTEFNDAWIDKLCKFWDYPDGENSCSYGLLAAIYKDDEYPFVTYSGGVDVSYRYCKPVTETDEEFFDKSVAKDLKMLRALEAAGVDNWDGYDIAFDEANKDE